MHRIPRGLKGVVALGTTVLLVGAAVPAVFAAPGFDPASESASTTTISSAMPPTTAARRADTAYDESATTPGAAVPIVTVETTPTGPKIVAHPVTSDIQASAVAKDAARGNDLIAVQSDKVVHAIGTPARDTYLSDQWNLNPSKTTYTKAWDVTTGGGVTVAVIDTGVSATHPDLAGRVLSGHEFLHPTPNGPAVDRDVPGPMTDNCGHGTHVAGTIAAIPNNGIGIAGTAPGVKILPVRVLDCSGYSSDVANGIKWAANKGAKVISLSLGGPGPDSALAAAVSYARGKGAVVIAAAGNNHGVCTNGKNATSYPGASNGVIGVGAVDANYAHACFSNTGKYVDVAGPGVHILSTYPVGLTGKGYAPYMYMDGTSMATPHVSAAAALIIAKWPTCTPDRVEARLESTAKRLGTGWPNNSFGYGLVDPAKAVAGTAKTC